MIKAIQNRKTVRKFKDNKVEPEKVERMLRAAMRAPSAMNGQPWEFIVVDDPAVLEKMKDYSGGARALQTAPLAIVVLEKELPEREARGMTFMGAHDLGACTQNILLQAVEDGLAAGWMSVRPEPEKTLRQILNFPENMKAFAVLAVGYAAEDVDMTVEDRFDESRIHYNKY